MAKGYLSPQRCINVGIDYFWWRVAFDKDVGIRPTGAAGAERQHLLQAAEGGREISFIKMWREIVMSAALYLWLLAS